MGDVNEHKFTHVVWRMGELKAVLPAMYNVFGNWTIRDNFCFADAMVVPPEKELARKHGINIEILFSGDAAFETLVAPLVGPRERKKSGTTYEAAEAHGKYLNGGVSENPKP